MLKRFWVPYGIVLFLWTIFNVGTYFGPTVEVVFHPVRAHESVEVTERTAERMCWMWSGDKLWSPPVINVDAFLIVEEVNRSGIIVEKERFFVAPYNQLTGLPYKANSLFPAGHFRVPFCVKLPDGVNLYTPIRLEQFVYFRGFAGFWTLRVPIPTLSHNGF